MYKACALIWLCSLWGITPAQTLSLQAILDSIASKHPAVKMYDYEIRSMDEAARGARSWMPPVLGAGFWMVPYEPKMWKSSEHGEPGMGQFMLSAEQMFPNKKVLDANETFMQAMSSVEKEKKQSWLVQLFAEAKLNYYEWLILKKKIAILKQNEALLDFITQSAEIRYKNNAEKINAYYKAKAAKGELENMLLMIENEIRLKQIALATLMNRDKQWTFDIDTIYSFTDFSAISTDTSALFESKSELRAYDRQINLNLLQLKTEKTKLRPEFGIKYDHMFAWSENPWQFSLMGMMRLPLAPWSSKMFKANIESLKWKSLALQQGKQMMLNETLGMTAGMIAELATGKKQLRLYEEKIIPALRNNYESYLLGYEQNTEELFMLFDAWETLNMTQMEYLEQLEKVLLAQTELERILEIR